MVKKTLAEELRRLRKNRQASLREVEKATGISNAYLSQLEKGAAANPSPHKLFKLAEYYGVQYEWLMQLTGYIHELSLEDPSTSPVRGKLDQLLMSAQLSSEEEEQVAEFISFLCTRRESG